MSTIQFFNTLSSQKEKLNPIFKNEVRMYCCGVTPYNHTHIGHSRTFFTYDLLYRTLKDHKYNVKWARNITDVDDKIIKKANAENVTCEQIVNQFVNEQNELLELFNLYRPCHEPKVTENIPKIIELIQTLIHKEFAYSNNSGVYFRVRKFESYGKLSKNKIDDLKQGARIEVDEQKEDALDFALWKASKPMEIFWESPWGNGRPGWHIECSAMIHSLYGDTIDIHMGGRDLIFPHHEAEIAQSEALTGKPLASIWMHAGMVTLYGEKMSKSTNHYVSIKDFIAKTPPEVLRLVFLSVSYAQPLDFTFELVTENLKKLSKIYRFVSLVSFYCDASNKNENINTHNEFKDCIFNELENLVEKMQNSISDDLNSAAAIAIFLNFIRTVNSKLTLLEKNNQILNSTDISLLSKHWEVLKTWLQNSLGLLNQTPQEFFESLRKFNISSEITENEINEKIEIRNKARQVKDWITSDNIRDELLKYGILIQDTARGTKWSIDL